ncbi:hypothetical protein [Mycobacterium sp.]|uniref:hypothetical protein n=1 Tax=Mycobacterium sp. TaxID=1785 RepID=UPI003F967F57
MTAERIQWGRVLDEARVIVESYDTPVTLRQLFYRLVAAELLPNVASAYKRLSAVTAEARRDGTFPELSDRTRQVHEYQTFFSPRHAVDYVRRIYRRDRTENQDVSLYLGVEKNGIVSQLQAWFGRPLGLPILALGGYASQSYADEVAAHVEQQNRPAVLLYAGDHDPSGWDIPRDFVDRTDCWKHVHRVALTPEQIDEHDLPEAMGKETDSRKTGFVQRFGRLVQVELDALPPDVLRRLYQDALDSYWDESTFEAVIEREATERAELDAG